MYLQYILYQQHLLFLLPPAFFLGYDARAVHRQLHSCPITTFNTAALVCERDASSNFQQTLYQVLYPKFEEWSQEKQIQQALYLALKLERPPNPPFDP